MVVACHMRPEALLLIYDKKSVARCHSTSREVGKYWLIFCIRIKKKKPTITLPAVFGLSGTIKLNWTKGRPQKSALTVEGNTNVQRGWVGPIAPRWTPPVLASPANAQGETETLWPRPKMLRLNFRSVLSCICSVVALLGWSLSLFLQSKTYKDSL